MTCATCPKNWRCIMACGDANDALNRMEDGMGIITRERSIFSMSIITLAVAALMALAILIVTQIVRCTPVPNDAGYYGEAHYRAVHALNVEEP